MNAIVRCTAEELEAEGAYWGDNDLVGAWEACEKIAKKLAERLGGVLIARVEDIFDKQDNVKGNTIFLVAETEFTASIRHATNRRTLFCYALMQSRKFQNHFIIVVPWDARVDKRVIYSCEEFQSLGAFTEALGKPNITNSNWGVLLDYVTP